MDKLTLLLIFHFINYIVYFFVIIQKLSNSLLDVKTDQNLAITESTRAKKSITLLNFKNKNVNQLVYIFRTLYKIICNKVVYKIILI